MQASRRKLEGKLTADFASVGARVVYRSSSLSGACPLCQSATDDSTLPNLGCIRFTIVKACIADRIVSFAYGGYRKKDTSNMSPNDTSSSEPDAAEHVPFMQRVLDNPFLLLFLGVAIPTVLYTLWGVMEIASIPIAK